MTDVIQHCSPAIAAFERRLAFHVSQGLTGAEVYRALASDPEVPSTFDPDEAGHLLGMGKFALKLRRKNGQPPDYLFVGRQIVLYPREAICAVLASAYRSTVRTSDTLSAA